MFKLSDKRKFKRETCLVPVDGKRGGGFDHIATTDLSKGGIGIVSQIPIPLNKEITVALDVAEEAAPVFVKGKVKWVHPMPGSGCYRVGISFQEVLAGSKSRLQHYFQQASV